MNAMNTTQRAMLHDAVLMISRLLLASIFLHEGAFLVANFASCIRVHGQVGVPTFLFVVTIAPAAHRGLRDRSRFARTMGSTGAGTVLSRDCHPVSHEFFQSQRTATFREGSRDCRRNVRIDGARRRRLVHRPHVAAKDVGRRDTACRLSANVGLQILTRPRRALDRSGTTSADRCAGTVQRDGSAVAR